MPRVRRRHNPDPPAYTPHAPAASFVQRLRAETAGVRLYVSKFGVRKALTREQVAEASQPFEADAHYLSASKKLIDTHYPAYKAVTKTLSQARSYWRTMTVDFPVDGIRLLRKSLVSMFDAQMKKFREELNSGINALEGNYQALRTEAQNSLGSLFDPGDYPASLRGAFGIAWDYPSVEPPDYLKDLNPELYKAEQEKIAARFTEAIRAAEEAFATELAGMVSHLVDVLTPGPDGQPKKLQKNAVENIGEFVTRFRAMQVTDNAQLTELVNEAERIVGGVDAAELRREQDLRTRIAEDMTRLRERVSQMVVAAPERRIVLDDE